MARAPSLTAFPRRTWTVLLPVHLRWVVALRKTAACAGADPHLAALSLQMRARAAGLDASFLAATLVRLGLPRPVRLQWYRSGRKETVLFASVVVGREALP